MEEIKKVIATIAKSNGYVEYCERYDDLESAYKKHMDKSILKRKNEMKEILKLIKEAEDNLTFLQINGK